MSDGFARKLQLERQSGLIKRLRDFAFVLARSILLVLRLDFSGFSLEYTK